MPPYPSLVVYSQPDSAPTPTVNIRHHNAIGHETVRWPQVYRT